MNWDTQAVTPPGTHARTVGWLALALAMTLAALRAHWTIALIVGLGCATASILFLRRSREQRATRITRALIMTVMGVWSATAVYTGITRWDPADWAWGLGSLAVVVALAWSTIAWSWSRERVNHEIAEEAQQKETEVTDPPSSAWETVAREWVERLDRIARTDITRADINPWNGPLVLPADSDGFTLNIVPKPGTMLDDIARHCARLAADARLPFNCTVTAQPHERQGLYAVDVQLKPNEAPKELARNLEKTSIHTGFPVLLRPDGRLATLRMRQNCVKIISPMGGAKTTVMNAGVSGMLRSDDTLVFGLDLGKDGDFASRWMRNYRNLDRPTPLEWCARDPLEGRRMVEALKRGMKARRETYRPSGDLEVNHEVPHIVLACDEGAALFQYLGKPVRTRRERAMKELGEAVLDLIEVSRDMGCTFLVSFLDLNLSSLGDTRLLKYAPVTLYMTSKDTSTIGRAFGNQTVRLDPSQMGRKGDAATNAPTEDTPGDVEVIQPYAARTWIIDAEDQEFVAAETEDRRPVMDTVTAEAMGEDYRTRWDRANWLWESEPMPTYDDEDDDEPDTAAPRRSGGGGADPLGLSKILGASPKKTTDEELQRQFAEALGQLPETDEPPRPDLTKTTPPAPRRTDPHKHAYQLLKDAGPDGYGPQALTQRLEDEGIVGDKGDPIARTTVQGWMQKWVETGKAFTQGSGRWTRYVHIDHEAPN